MDRLQKAIESLGMIRLIKLDQKEIRLVILLDRDEWKHLSAPWWRGKSASIVAVDINGDFVLCKSSGEFVLWCHKESEEFHISNNLETMLSKLEIDFSNMP